MKQGLPIGMSRILNRARLNAILEHLSEGPDAAGQRVARGAQASWHRPDCPRGVERPENSGKLGAITGPKSMRNMASMLNLAKQDR